MIIQETPITILGFDPQEFGDVEIHVSVYDEGHGAEVGQPSGVGVIGHALFEGSDAHVVTVQANETSHVSFGVIAVPVVDPPEPVVDSKMGDDPHAGSHDDSATPIEFHDNHATLNSYVDTDGDVDVFRFIGNGHVIVAEGGSDGVHVEFELLDAAGNSVATGSNGEEFAAKTEDGETYFLRVSGNQGQYDLNLIQRAATDPEVEPPTVVGDTDGDGDVDFGDFLVVSTNFGQEVDAAFADGDFDGNGSVDFADFLALSANFGQTA